MTLEFPATYSRMIARELQLDDDGVRALLAGTSLTPDALVQLDRQIGLADQYQIINNGLNLSGNPAFGLQVGSRMPLAAHGSVGAAASSASTLREAFAVIDRFQGLRSQFVKLLYHTEGARYCIDMQLQVPLDAVGLFLLEAMIATTQWVIEFILGRSATDASVELAYPAPAHGGRYNEYLHGVCRFEAPVTRLSIPVEWLATPNPFADPHAYTQALWQCERLEAARQPQETWPAKVTRLLQQHPGQLWTLPEVASALNVSTRSLTRHLQAANAHYQGLLDEELFRQTRLHFETGRHTVASVAAAVGYHDVAAFRRAFRRWSGRSPQAWLQQRLNGDE